MEKINTNNNGEKSEKFSEKKEVKIECENCQKEVLSILTPYGGGYVGLCPECKGIVYDKTDLPPEKEK
jgi:Zn finger protein HypA/HybF involved in hydrogenase expression